MASSMTTDRNNVSTSTHRLNRRQRKKKNLGEFQELGFEFKAAFKKPPSETERDLLINDFLDTVIGNGLEFGGGASDDFTGFVVSMKRYGKVDDSQRDIIRAWLANHELLDDVTVGPLRDVWHGWG